MVWAAAFVAALNDDGAKSPARCATVALSAVVAMHQASSGLRSMGGAGSQDELALREIIEGT